MIRIYFLCECGSTDGELVDSGGITAIRCLNPKCDYEEKVPKLSVSPEQTVKDRKGLRRIIDRMIFWGEKAVLPEVRTDTDSKVLKYLYDLSERVKLEGDRAESNMVAVEPRLIEIEIEEICRQLGITKDFRGWASGN